MTDLGCFLLAGGMIGAAWIVSRSIVEVARWRSTITNAHMKAIRRTVLAAAEEIAAAMRHRTRAGLGLVRAKAPPPTPPDPRMAKGIEAIERLGLSAEETDDLIGQYEAVAGLRKATRDQIETYIARLAQLRVPLPS